MFCDSDRTEDEVKIQGIPECRERSKDSFENGKDFISIESL